ncbi:MAG: aminopeptidase P family protein [Bacillales bacterium]|nr:aminopeptidase P family protein [Bacillales bacterium]
MKINEKIGKLRKKMIENGIDAYLIDNADYHSSEYVHDYFKERSFISGFDGSSGKVLVTLSEAFLWTDGRYFIQAEKDLLNTGIVLMKMGIEGYPSLLEYINLNLKGKTLGFNGKYIPYGFVQAIDDHVKIKDDKDLIEEIWLDRPSISFSNVYNVPLSLVGETTNSKLLRVREKLVEKNAEVFVLASLTDIAWLYNMRGNDVSITPVFFSFAIVTADESILFADEDSFSKTALTCLKKSNTVLKPYNEFFPILSLFNSSKILLDESALNYSFVQELKKKNVIINAVNPTFLMKAVKNEVEIKNNKSVHLADGIAVFRLMKYLKENYGKIKLDEYSVAEKVLSYRKADKRFYEVSFETIASFNENAAIIHYEPTRISSKAIDSDGFLLIDSGGQYLGGTTDITRTVSLGQISEEMKHHYTMVLRAMIGVSKARFMAGCSGQNLDILSRQFFWKEGLDYKHGTGHGVGYMLNVHEGPNGFRWNKVEERSDSSVIHPGMITTIEPGIYLENKYGIRIENELLSVFDSETEWGKYLKFDTITLCPIDVDPIIVKELDKDEKKWLNSYHKTVYKKLAKYIDPEEKEYLKYITRKI